MSPPSSYIYSLHDTVNIRDGKVGIGTLTPKESFHVQGGSVYLERIVNDASNIDFSYSTLSNVKALRIDQMGGLTSGKINFLANQLSNVDNLSVNVITSDSDTITFNTKSLSNINYAYITQDVVVGHTLTASNLQVIGDFTTLNTLTSNTEQMTVTNAGSGPALIVRQTGDQPVARFYDDSTLAMYIGGTAADAGFVGINTDAADSRLHIYDSAATYVHLQTSTTDEAQVKLTNASGDTFVGPSSSGTIDLYSTAVEPIRIGTNSTANMLRIETDGNVGIATDSALYKLDVWGTTRVKDAFYLTTQNMNTIFYSYGGESLNASSTFIGLTLAWANVTTDNKLAFRVKVKCHLASDNSIAYRKFETIVTPANDSASGKPKQIVATEIADTNNDDFTSMTHTVARTNTKAVDLKVTWATALTNYIGNIQVEVFASTSLGDFTFTPIHN